METTWNDLPGPRPRWWGLPALAAMRRDDLGSIAAHQRLGDLVRLQILGERTVDVFDPEWLRQLMVDHADALIRWERGPEVFADGLGQSVLVTEGAAWQRQRRMLMQGFTPKRVAGYGTRMLEAATLGLNALRPGEVAMDSLFSHLGVWAAEMQARAGRAGSSKGKSANVNATRTPTSPTCSSDAPVPAGGSDADAPPDA